MVTTILEIAAWAVALMLAVTMALVARGFLPVAMRADGSPVYHLSAGVVLIFTASAMRALYWDVMPLALEAVHEGSWTAWHAAVGRPVPNIVLGLLFIWGGAPPAGSVLAADPRSRARSIQHPHGTLLSARRAHLPRRRFAAGPLAAVTRLTFFAIRLAWPRTFGSKCSCHRLRRAGYNRAFIRRKGVGLRSLDWEGGQYPRGYRIHPKTVIIPVFCAPEQKLQNCFIDDGHDLLSPAFLNFLLY